MGIGRINGTGTDAYTGASENVSKKAAENTAKNQETAAAVYDKNGNGAQAPKTNPKVDTATIDRLKADAEARSASLRNLVEKLLLKQGGTSATANGSLASLFKNLDVDEATRLQAQKDIADDGYWGVDQTSDRILSFAKALAGDDRETAEEMLEAVKKGFKAAEKSWGESLPDISQRTISATYDKMNKWIDSLGSSDKTGAAEEPGNTEA